MNPTTIAALYTFAAHYHSGQWSRGYRLLCMAERAWERRAKIGVRLDYWEREVTREGSRLKEIYDHLVSEYAGNV
jgi:hypothetical protein